MNDTARQLAEIKARSNPQVQVMVRQVRGGYIVSGQIQYIDAVTGGNLAAINGETVCPDAIQCAEMTYNFMMYGQFDIPAEQVVPTRAAVQPGPLQDYAEPVPVRSGIDVQPITLDTRPETPALI